MVNKVWSLRNFKKCLGLIEDIAKQTDARHIDFAYGYAYATIKERSRARALTRHQENALFELADDAALSARAIAEIKEADAKKAKEI